MPPQRTTDVPLARGLVGDDHRAAPDEPGRPRSRARRTLDQPRTPHARSDPRPMDQPVLDRRRVLAALGGGLLHLPCARRAVAWLVALAPRRSIGAHHRDVRQSGCAGARHPRGRPQRRHDPRAGCRRQLLLRRGRRSTHISDRATLAMDLPRGSVHLLRRSGDHRPQFHQHRPSERRADRARVVPDHARTRRGVGPRRLGPSAA
ncbi:Uncharacterised protein [Mycobacteroides abscessus subsp. abscessus]|nr:Uncharacterised protein [Mycobacteroides abscessus subsp. abscessus]